MTKRDPNIPRLDLNPSSADRWTTCTASPRFIMENWDKIPRSTDTPYNMEGTTAHEVAAAWLQNREPDPKNCPVPIDGEMRLHGWNYAEYVESLKEPNAIVEVEKKYPLWYMPERNAMVDAVVLNPRNLHIVDYKYGEGIVVSPEENLQGAIYARSVLREIGDTMADDFPITIHIYQPRGRNAEDGAVHKWETTWEDLKLFTDKFISYPAQRILNSEKATTFSDAPHSALLDFVPSEKACQWCPAKGFCTARQQSFADEIEALAVIDDTLTPLPSPGTMSLQQLGAVLKHGADITQWIEDVKEYATDYMRAGNKIPGFKLVTSRGGNRKWSDPAKACTLLQEQTILRFDEIVTKEVIGPAAVEKLLGKQGMSGELLNLITKTPGVPVIAPEDDKRPALEAVTGEGEFEVLKD